MTGSELGGGGWSEVAKALKVDFGPTRQAWRKAVDLRRSERVAEARSWPPGEDFEHQKFVVIWEGSGYSVRIGKPGKEAQRKGGARNADDMLPAICALGGGQCRPDVSFNDVNKEYLGIYEQGDKRKYLVLLACLHFRNAFLIDHVKINGGWRYRPPQIVIDRISAAVPEILGVPVEVFLQYMDCISWNEDVKYWDRPGNNAGQVNNMLSAVSTICGLTGKIKFIDFIAPLIQQGVHPITQKRAIELFPFLRGENDPALEQS